MSEKSELGRRGEVIATEYLVKKGFDILHNNWTYKNKELDIVALKDNYLVVIEVKSRKENYIVDPIESITPRKQKFLFDASESYAEIYNLDEDIRFDIVLVIFSETSHTIEHVEDAFRPGW
jgi:putative endonuclease